MTETLFRNYFWLADITHLISHQIFILDEFEIFN